MNDLNTLSRADLLRQIARMDERMRKIEGVLQGQQIGTPKISSLLFDRIQGGRGVLGGLNNTSGVLEVRDEANNEAVILDKNGIQINNGKLTIKDENNTTVIDSEGIISTGAFRSYSATNLSAGLSTALTTEQAVPGSALDTVTFTRPTRVLFVLMGEGYNDAVFSSAASFPYMELLFHDTVTDEYFTNVAMRADTAISSAWSFDGSGYVFDLEIDYFIGSQLTSRSQIRTIDAGTHTYELAYRAVNAGTANLSAWHIGIIILGT